MYIYAIDDNVRPALQPSEQTRVSATHPMELKQAEVVAFPGQCPEQGQPTGRLQDHGRLRHSSAVALDHIWVQGPWGKALVVLDPEVHFVVSREHIEHGEKASVASGLV